MARWEQEPTHPPAELGGSALQENAPAKYVTEGLNARTKFCPASARRGNISLDIPFYRTKRLVVRNLSGEPLVSDFELYARLVDSGMALACWKQPIFEGFAPSRVCLHVQAGGCVTTSGALASSVSHGLMEAMPFRLTDTTEDFRNSGARLDLPVPGTRGERMDGRWGPQATSVVDRLSVPWE